MKSSLTFSAVLADVSKKPGFFGVLLGVGRGNGALIGGFGDEIEFVAREGDDDVFVGLALEFFYPGFCFV